MVNKRIIVAIDDMSDEERWALEDVILKLKGVVRVHTEPQYYKDKVNLEVDALLVANAWTTVSQTYQLPTALYENFEDYINQVDEASRRIRSMNTKNEDTSRV